LPNSNGVPNELCLRELPNKPILGSFWIELSENNILLDKTFKKNIINQITTKNKLISPIPIDNILKSNLNKKMILTCKNLSAKNTDLPYYDLDCEILQVNPKIVILKSDDNIHVVKIDDIINFKCENIELFEKLEIQDKKEENSININYIGPGGHF